MLRGGVAKKFCQAESVCVMEYIYLEWREASEKQDSVTRVSTGVMWFVIRSCAAWLALKIFGLREEVCVCA